MAITREDTNVSDNRLISLILLIALAYTSATIKGQIIKHKGIQKYVGRVKESGHLQRRHSSFYIGLHAQTWVKFSHELIDFIQELIKLNRNKRCSAVLGVSPMSDCIKTTEVLFTRNESYKPCPVCFITIFVAPPGFDHGGDNWLTGVSTHGRSLIIDGRKLKSMNQWYSKLAAKYKKGKSDLYWDSNLDRVQRKRNNQMRDGINKAARFLINRCLNDRVGNLIIGWNERQKDSAKMGKRENQNFVAIPTKRLINRLEQLCPEYGIKLTITEESYTSKASYLDDDSLPKYGEKPNGWTPSGKRVKRGLYKSSKGHLVNADCNGAGNIARKVAAQLGLDLTKAGRGALALPHRYDLFDSLSRSYRTRSVRVASAKADSRTDLSCDVTTL